MQPNSVWWAAITVTGILVCLQGCQFPSFRTAQRVAKEAQDRPPNDRQVADVQISLGRSMELRGEFEPAMAAYRKAIENDPKRSTGYWRMALLLDKQGNIEESGTHYRQALKIDPKNADLLCDVGYSLYLQRRWAESEDKLRQAIAIKPKHSRAHNNLGLLLAHTDHEEEALVEFRKAGLEEADAHTNLAFALAINRHWDQAREHYELALQANPNSALAKSGLEKLNAVVAKIPESSRQIAQVGYERLERITNENSDKDMVIHADGRSSR